MKLCRGEDGSKGRSNVGREGGLAGYEETMLRERRGMQWKSKNYLSTVALKDISHAAGKGVVQPYVSLCSTQLLQIKKSNGPRCSSRKLWWG